MTTIFNVCAIVFVISMIIIFILHYKSDKTTKEMFTKIEDFYDYNLECKFRDYHKKFGSYQSMIALFSLCMGFCITICCLYRFIMIEGVKEYLRDNVEVKYQSTYEDSVLVKSDTIINLK